MENCSDALLGCGSLYLRPTGVSMNKFYSLQEVDKQFSLCTGEMEKRGSRDAALGLPHTTGERGVTLITF